MDEKSAGADWLPHKGSQKIKNKKAPSSQAYKLIFFLFIRVGGPEGYKLRQFVALTQDVGARQFVALTQDLAVRGYVALTQYMVCPRSTKTQGRIAGGGARGAVNYFFCLLKYFL